VGPGVFLAILGAIFTFAVRADVPGVDIHIVGLILMIAGAALIAHARAGTRRERVRTTVEEPADSSESPRVIQDTVIDRDVR
jgi:hypothetical protein